MNYLVDFKLMRPNPRQNRTCYSFTLAESFRGAAKNVWRSHPGEVVVILGVYHAPNYKRPAGVPVPK